MLGVRRAAEASPAPGAPPSLLWEKVPSAPSARAGPDFGSGQAPVPTCKAGARGPQGCCPERACPRLPTGQLRPRREARHPPDSLPAQGALHGAGSPPCCRSPAAPAAPLNGSTVPAPLAPPTPGGHSLCPRRAWPDRLTSAWLVYLGYTKCVAQPGHPDGTRTRCGPALGGPVGRTPSPGWGPRPRRPAVSPVGSCSPCRDG